jgi:hypothetical protein
MIDEEQDNYDYDYGIEEADLAQQLSAPTENG